jgi:FSR family fosmidomycin resistance protein-like MFS transporter
MTAIQEQSSLTESQPVPKNDAEDFQTTQVVTFSAAHGAHDIYFSFLPTILPLLIQNFGLSTTQAGLLSSFTQIPNLLQPLIGHQADRKNLRMLVVLAPAISALLITLVGIAPNFNTSAILLILAGLSTACFHAIAPVMVGAYSGRKIGRGMGFFMVGGELGFGIGPIVVVATISGLTLRGLPWLMIFGLLISIILLFRLKNASTVRQADQANPTPARQAVWQMRGLMIPIMAITFITAFLNANIVNYLPTFMSYEGAAFAVAGISLAIVELSGTGGAFLMGVYSDRLGQRNVAFIGILFSVVFSIGFLLTDGWLKILMLIGIGLSAFVANPAFLAMIQTRFHTNRSLANGVYMSSSFILRSIVVVIVGILADRFGMRPVFAGSALIALLGLPFLFLLPAR